MEGFPTGNEMRAFEQRFAGWMKQSDFRIASAVEYRFDEKETFNVGSSDVRTDYPLLKMGKSSRQGRTCRSAPRVSAGFFYRPVL